jgi:DNA-binding CsgD family transcriptional regulator
MARPSRSSANAEQTADSPELQNLDSIEGRSGDVVQERSAAREPETQQSIPISSPRFSASVGGFREDSVSNSGTPRDVVVALTYGLELVRHGAMLVADEGQPRFANRTALAILEKKDGISLARTGLVADRVADTRLLHRLLREAISSPDSGEPKDSPMTLQRRIANSALIIRVIPGPGLGCWDGRTALLKLYDQDLSLVVDEHALSSLYGLTRGEASLAALLMRGKSIDEAAAQLFISNHTARTHLKRIFMKTDTHRQTELVVRMMLTVL